MAHPWRRRFGLLMVSLLTGGGLVVGSGGSSPVPVALAASFGGGPAAGSGAAPWEVFHSIRLNQWMSLHVNVANGNLKLQTVGLHLPGVNGLDLNVDPTYNSLSSNYATTIGYGWTLGTGGDVGLTIAGTRGTTFHDPSGSMYQFSTPSNCTYNAPAGADAQLACVGTTYQLTMNASRLQYGFDSGGNLQTLTNVEGNRITFASTFIADTEGRNTNLTLVGGSHPLWVSVVTDPAGRTWNYTYDSSNNLIKITDPTGNHTDFTYSSVAFHFHDLIGITDPLGNRTNITYDGGHRVTRIVRVTNSSLQTGPAWGVAYGTSSTQVTDPNNRIFTYAYDSTGRLTSITDPDSTMTQTTWTADNHVATERLPSGATTSNAYDTNNNLTSRTLPTGPRESMAYTNVSFPYLPTTVTDAQGNTTAIQYNSKGLATTVTDASMHNLTFSYNPNGTVATQTDQNGHLTAYAYNPQGLRTQTTYPSPLGARSCTYNNYYLCATETDGKSQVTTFSYDVLGQVTVVTYADQHTVGYAHDANGNLLSEADSTGSTNYAYNALNQLTQETLPNANTIGYTWDGADNLLTKTDSGGTTTYGYNSRDEIATIKDPQNAQTTVTHDMNGNRTQVAYPNGVTENMTYDSSGQLLTITARNGVGSTLKSFSYSSSGRAPACRRRNTTRCPTLREPRRAIHTMCSID